MQTALTPAISGGSKIIEGLPKRLIEYLNSSTEEAATLAIAADPAMIAQVRVALPALRIRAMAPATAKEIEATIERRFELYPQPVRAPAQWAMWWTDYIGALQGLPAAAIELAMRVWVALPDSQFLPKPGQLRELAMVQRTPAAMAYAIASAASRMEDERSQQRGALQPDFALTHPPEAKTAESRERVLAMAAEIGERLARLPAMPRISRPSPEEAEVGPDYHRMMREGLAGSPAPPRSRLQRIADTLDAGAQGRLAEGRHITPRMIAHLAAQKAADDAEDQAQTEREGAWALEREGRQRIAARRPPEPVDEGASMMLD